MKMWYVIGFILLSGCGKQGAPGIPGNPGSPASPCSVTSIAIGQPEAPNGGSLISCPDGSSSLVLNGTNGMAGTTVTPIQFCPGVTTYPNEFNELGFCILGNIYAVYSIPGAFMTLIPPGEYSSTGVNSTCTFTVGINCSITQN